MTCKIINLEQGMPTKETAGIRLNQELRMAKVAKVKVVKIIHGYGSSGKGGVLKRHIYRLLMEQKKAGNLQIVIKGEDFTPFDVHTRNAMKLCPFLSKDSDLSRSNHGITIVVL